MITKHLLSLMLVFTFGFSAVLAEEKEIEQTEGPSMHFEERTHDFGIVEHGDKVTHVFKFVNNGTEPVVINRVRPSCGCTISEYTKEPVAPGEKGEIHAEFNSQNRHGSFSNSIRVTSNADPVSLQIRGKVE